MVVLAPLSDGQVGQLEEPFLVVFLLEPEGFEFMACLPPIEGLAAVSVLVEGGVVLCCFLVDGTIEGRVIDKLGLTHVLTLLSLSVLTHT